MPSKLTSAKLKAAILKGLENAQSGEASRVVEGLEWLPERELKSITAEVNKLLVKSKSKTVKCFWCFEPFTPGENYRKGDDCPSCEAEIDQEVDKLMEGFQED